LFGSGDLRTSLGEITMVEGFGGLASGSPGWFYFGLSHVIPHSCLEYGTGVIGLKERFGSTPIYSQVVHGSP